MSKKRSWSESDLRDAASRARSIRQILYALKLKEAGGNYAQVQKYLRYYKIEVPNLKGKGWNKGLRGIGKPIVPLKQILIKNSDFQNYKLKRRLFLEKLKPDRCELCGWHKRTDDGRLPLELDHINGDRKDNRLKNLRILCPNCHSLQSTHRGRNIAKYRASAGIGRQATLKMLW